MKMFFMIVPPSYIEQEIDKVSKRLVESIGPDMLAYVKDVFTQIGQAPVGEELAICRFANPEKYHEMEENIIELTQAAFREGITKSAVLKDIAEYVESERQKSIEAQQIAYLENLPPNMTQH